MEPIPLSRSVLGTEESAAATDVIASGFIGQGKRVADFEHALRARVGALHGVAVSSGTAALHLALTVLGIGSGDEVVLPSLSQIATANAVRYVGARPIFADVDRQTHTLTPATLAEVVTPATMAVILVHQAGVPADIEAIHEACNPGGIAVIEDATEALGSTYRGRPVGGHSDLVALSFESDQVITTGEGGALTTSSEPWAGRLRMLRQHGLAGGGADGLDGAGTPAESFVEVGFDYRLTDIQAAIGLVQLERLDGLVQRRRVLAERYRAGLAGLPGLETARDPGYGTTNYQSFWIVLPEDLVVDRDELVQGLTNHGISAARGRVGIHLEPAYRGEAPVPLRVSESVSARSIRLPLFDGMTDDQVDHVVAAVLDAAGSASRAL